MSNPTAKLRWIATGRVGLKLKANTAVALNMAYTVGPLPDYLKLFDEEGDALENASFVDIQKKFSIEYEGTRYHFDEDPMQDRRRDESAVTGLVVAGAPPSTPRSKDISNQIASVFEGEVNAYLDDNFQSVLPRCNFSRFRSREIEDNAALEMDSFAYMTKDTRETPEIKNTLGIYVVELRGVPLKKPKGAPRKLAKSPGVKAANLERTAEKYVVGESYSGDREDRIKRKVKELEEKLVKLKDRHETQSCAVSDVTSLFGAAILSFTCQSLPRKDQSKKCMAAVLEELSSDKTPILWRLAQAKRLFLVVLSTKEGPCTCALREITRGISGLEVTVEVGISTILERLDEQAGVEKRVEMGEQDHQYG